MMMSSPRAARADDGSDVTWHHMIVHGCKGQKYLRVRVHKIMVIPGPIPGAGQPHVEIGLPTWRGSCMYGSYLGVGIQAPMHHH